MTLDEMAGEKELARAELAKALHLCASVLSQASDVIRQASTHLETVVERENRATQNYIAALEARVSAQTVN